MKASRVLASAVLAASLSWTGCEGPVEPAPEPAPPGILESVYLRPVDRVDHQVTAEELSSLSAGITDFGVALYRQGTAGSDTNQAFSPFALTDALAMVYAGTVRDTERELAGVLPVSPTESGRRRFNPALGALGQTLDGRHNPPNGLGGDDDVSWRNLLWARLGTPLEKAYLSTLQDNHFAGVYLENFRTNPRVTRSEANTYFNAATNNRIQDVIPEDGLSQDERLLLVSTLTLRASWRTPFSRAETQEQPFHPRRGSPVLVPMMRTRGVFPFLAGDGYDAVALPATGDALRLLIILPNAGRFLAVESGLSRAFLDEVRAGLRERSMALELPRFEVRQGPALAEALGALGMGRLLAPGAELSRLSADGDLWLSHVYQQAPMIVGEAGLGLWVGPPAPDAEEPTTALTVNRPFLFAVEDVASGTLLSLGRYVGP
ncbi:serpin family protein [Corallococcus aberystwythensis]|nr:serpin family protein [Corallococcus aberystwythensis]